MSSTSGVITLTNFAPLIQLWAGFCLLFFYETLFKHSPLAYLVEGLKKLHKEFVMEYIDFIPKNEIMDFVPLFLRLEVVRNVKNWVC